MIEAYAQLHLPFEDFTEVFGLVKPRHARIDWTAELEAKVRGMAKAAGTKRNIYGKERKAFIDDCVADIYRKLASGRLKSEHGIYRAVLNLAVDYIRKRVRESRVEMVPIEYAADISIGDVDQRAELDSLIHRSPFLGVVGAATVAGIGERDIARAFELSVSELRDRITLERAELLEAMS